MVRGLHQNPQHALIMGPPGGGKGTLAKRIVNDFGFEVLSTGDMIRAQIRQETEVCLIFSNAPTLSYTKSRPV